MSSTAAVGGSQGLTYRTGTLMVAVAASVSWCCCIGLASYITWSALHAWRDRTGKHAHKLRFLRTQFGVLFANLVISDTLQATGFSLSYVWVGLDRQPSNEVSLATCSLQGALIQSGDLGSALWSLTIALHTAGFIVAKYKPSAKIVGGTVVSIWTFVVLLTIIGPLRTAFLRRTNPEIVAFYDNAGIWCWISKPHDRWRLWSHYFFVFLSAGISALAYATIFCFLYFRLFQRGVYSEKSGFGLRRAVNTGDTVDGNAQTSAAEPRVKLERNRNVEKVAELMLLFPITYIITIMPLAVFRVASMRGQAWTKQPKVQAWCGLAFALGGFCNTILYVLTRKIFRRDKHAGRSGSESDYTRTGTQQPPVSFISLGPLGTKDREEAAVELGEKEGKLPFGRQQEISGPGRKSSMVARRDSCSPRRGPSPMRYSTESPSRQQNGNYGRPGLRRQPSAMSQQLRAYDYRGTSRTDVRDSDFEDSDDEDGGGVDQAEDRRVPTLGYTGESSQAVEILAGQAGSVALGKSDPTGDHATPSLQSCEGKDT